MKTPSLLVRLVSVAVLTVPLSILATINDNTVKELKLVHFVEPVFPENLRIEGVAAGNVTLAVSRNAAGEPVDILVLTASYPRMADAAVEAVRQWRFTPSAGAAAPSLVRVGFRVQGVIVYPAGKNYQEEIVNEQASEQVQSPSGASRVQSLSPAPKALAQPMPAYPARLAAQHVEGTAEVRFYIDADGRVRLPAVVGATAPEFAEAAMAAVANWRYEPLAPSARAVAADRWAFKFQKTD